jgi:hypothetical protein
VTFYGVGLVMSSKISLGELVEGLYPNFRRRFGYEELDDVQPHIAR